MEEEQTAESETGFNFISRKHLTDTITTKLKDGALTGRITYRQNIMQEFPESLRSRDSN